MLNDDVISCPEAPSFFDGALMDPPESRLQELSSVITRTDTLLPDVDSPLLRLLSVPFDNMKHCLSS